MGIALMLFGVSTTLAADGDVILHETFDDANSTGGNDGVWSTDVNSAYSKTGWTFSKGNKGDRCLRLATGSATGSLQTPSLDFENGKTYTLIFRAGAWHNDETKLKVSYGTTVLVASLALTQDEFNIYSYSFIATGSNYIKIETTGKKRCFIDDIMVVEGTKVNVTIASSGWSTMTTPAGLDFSKATPAGLTAYIAYSVSGSGVTLTSVDEAAGAEGVMLKGSAGITYSIPIKADATKNDANKLSAAYSATPADADKIYILKDGKFCLVKTGGTKVPAGKAYLLASEVPSGAHNLDFNIDEGGDVTAISGIEIMRNGENETFFDLQGRRVAQPSKGLFIVNGKKVIVK